jgi:hypothetical protein
MQQTTDGPVSGRLVANLLVRYGTGTGASDGQRRAPRNGFPARESTRLRRAKACERLCLAGAKPLSLAGGARA